MGPNAKQSRITISAQPSVIDSPVTTYHEDHPRTLTLVGAGSPPPTLSNASVHFLNTTDFRSSQPTSQPGADSLRLLGPNSHQRKGTLSTNPDTDNIALTPFSSIRTKGAESTHDISEQPPQESAEKDGKGKTPDAPKSPLLDDVAYPTPYAFRSNSLANLFANNAKDLDALQQMGSAGELVWKRTVNGAVCRFLQFRISVNIAAAVIAFVTAVASSTESSVLTRVQLSHPPPNLRSSLAFNCSG